MRRPTLQAVIFVFALTASLLAQTQPPADKLSFEVASIKPTQTLMPGPVWSGGGRQMTVTSITPSMLIRGAFDLYENEMFGAPGWTASERFDINAAFEGEGTPARLAAMRRTLLEERFALKAHLETRDAPIYRAVLARKDGALGSQLIKSTVPCDEKGRAVPCGMRASGSTVQMSAQTVRYFLDYVESVVGRRITDETGLTGPFEITLEWSRGPKDTERPSVFTALQEQLGLRLESSRGPVTVLIIDHISRPTPD